MTKYYLYQITNLISNKKYIGITKNLTKRWWTHKNRKVKTAISYAIQKYGSENFEFKVLAENTREEILKLEQQTIKILNTKSPNGYNLTDGGEGSLGCLASVKHLRKLARDRVGTTLSEECKQKISQSETGKIVSLDTRYKLHRAALRRFSDPNEREKLSLAHKGKRLSDETKLKMSQSAHRGGSHHNAKKVLVFGKIYPCIKTAADALNINYGTLFSRIQRGLHPDKYRYL